LQSLSWYVLYGRWFFNGYAGEGFAFNFGNQLRLVLSSRHGLFFWHPITLVSLSGFFFAICRRGIPKLSRAFQGLCAGTLVGVILLYGAWSTWSMGWSFGA